MKRGRSVDGRQEEELPEEWVDLLRKRFPTIEGLNFTGFRGNKVREGDLVR